MVSCDRTKGKGHELKYRRFQLNIKNFISSYHEWQHWNRSSRETVEFPFLEIFKSCLDTVLGILLSVTLLWAGGLTSKRFLPTQSFCGCDILYQRDLRGDIHLISRASHYDTPMVSFVFLFSQGGVNWKKKMSFGLQRKYVSLKCFQDLKSN